MSRGPWRIAPLLLIAWLAAPAAAAQAWDAPEVTALLDRAAARRAATDATLRAWSAEATGTLRLAFSRR